ncbi:hypothetical protein K1719_007334 [Acacia pycnantha]|nr:hypothetical protein K1719_007334 [Acacia pycnantha]
MWVDWEATIICQNKERKQRRRSSHEVKCERLRWTACFATHPDQYLASFPSEERPDAREVVRLVNIQVEEFWKARERLGVSKKRVYMEEVVRANQWTVPPAGVIKINFDGSFKEVSGMAGVGVVCRTINREAWHGGDGGLGEKGDGEGHGENALDERVRLSCNWGSKVLKSLQVVYMWLHLVKATRSIKVEGFSKNAPPEFQNTKLMTRLTYTLDETEGHFEVMRRILFR